jgi:AhpD family alkylhydroperoxidase
MSRITTIEPTAATPAIEPLYQAVKQKLGLIPNMVKAMGHSETALRSYLDLSASVSTGKLRPSIREKIALLVAEQNECDYCVRAHTAIGGLMKIPANELSAARRGESEDNKEQALLQLTGAILEGRGAVSEAAYATAQTAGVTTEEATELVAHIALNIFTNYFNRFAQTPIDFPKVEAEVPASV